MHRYFITFHFSLLSEWPITLILSLTVTCTHKQKTKVALILIIVKEFSEDKYPLRYNMLSLNILFYSLIHLFCYKWHLIYITLKFKILEMVEIYVNQWQLILCESLRITATPAILHWSSQSSFFSQKFYPIITFTESKSILVIFSKCWHRPHLISTNFNHLKIAASYPVPQNYCS